MSATVHIVEPGGLGGVFQHAAALAAAVAEAGTAVVFHTAADAEEVTLPGTVVRRNCLWRFPALPPLLRRAVLVAGWLLAGVPRCLAAARPGDIVHIEGRFVPVLLVPLVAGARLRRCSVGFAPHTTFPRRAPVGSARVEEWLVRRLARGADVVFAFSAHDKAVIETWGTTVSRAPLMGAYAVRADPHRVDAWRRRWAAAAGADRPVVLFAGQLRHDKGLDLAVAAAGQWRQDAVLAVVGEDHGVLAGAVREATARGVPLVVDEGYRPLGEFVAAVAAADVVICPYRAASTSGVLALANALGRPTVVTDVGGSAEFATVAVAPGDAGALAAGVDKALTTGVTAPSWPTPADLAGATLAAYGLIGR